MAQTALSSSRGTRLQRLGFRLDPETKRQVERAAALERRSVTDFCLSALTQASQQTIAQHESLLLSERDRKIFFDTLVSPPKPNARLRRAFQSASTRVAAR
ncbi:DUF1778 domain-containing protein [Terracidiphilus sp.]|jgi:uncharacterized protein (DUF1778 family)|uniref:type II toxin-antitoxin system TacA family antitoxin n=1 Tax=Terracidiphilus sp. TaxID=1964191 RepID=UPI003C13D34E